MGDTKPISSVLLFSEILVMSEETLAIEYHVYIWQVSPQLSCIDICQIWMWFEESNMYFCHIETFAYGEIDERSFSNPHPWTFHFRCPSGIRNIALNCVHIYISVYIHMFASEQYLRYFYYLLTKWRKKSSYAKSDWIVELYWSIWITVWRFTMMRYPLIMWNSVTPCWYNLPLI